MSPLDVINPPTLSKTRQPRFTVTVNGVPLSGVVSAEVTNASHFTSDTFRVVLAANALPPGYGSDYWSLSNADQIGITATDDFGAAQLIIGQVDTIDYNPVETTIILSGRDLSASLIDTRSTEKFINQTSSQIAKTLAQRHGLKPNVKDTTTKAGTYYNIDHTVLTQDQSEWDLLIYLAKHEGFDVWVTGTTLNFQPPPAPTLAPYKLIAPGHSVSNLLRLDLTRSQTLAKDVIVKIRTWNQQQQKGFTVTYKVTQAYKSQRTGGKSQTYSYTVPNLTRDKALALAKSTAEDITRHERVLTATLPGDNRLTTRAKVLLTGTGTAWDQTYYPDTITRHISNEHGYVMDLRAKNHSTQSTVVLG